MISQEKATAAAHEGAEVLRRRASSNGKLREAARAHVASWAASASALETLSRQVGVLVGEAQAGVRHETAELARAREALEALRLDGEAQASDWRSLELEAAQGEVVSLTQHLLAAEQLAAARADEISWLARRVASQPDPSAANAANATTATTGAATGAAAELAGGEGLGGVAAGGGGHGAKGGGMRSHALHLARALEASEAALTEATTALDESDSRLRALEGEVAELRRENGELRGGGEHQSALVAQLRQTEAELRRARNELTSLKRYHDDRNWGDQLLREQLMRAEHVAAATSAVAAAAAGAQYSKVPSRSSRGSSRATSPSKEQGSGPSCVSVAAWTWPWHTDTAAQSIGSGSSGVGGGGRPVDSVGGSVELEEDLVGADPWYVWNPVEEEYCGPRRSMMERGLRHIDAALSEADAHVRSMPLACAE